MSSPKLFFKVLFWWYIIKKWTLTRILIRPWSSCFQRISGMQPAPKYSRISTWPEYISFCCHLEKIWKMCKISIWYPHTLSEKNKKNHLSIVTCSFEVEKWPISQKYHYQWWKNGSFVTIWNPKCNGLTRISAANPKGTIYQPLRSGRIWHKVNF